MTYTVWSRGRLLGESELDIACEAPGHRAGDFHPTSFGERLIPVAMSGPQSHAQVAGLLTVGQNGTDPYARPGAGVPGASAASHAGRASRPRPESIGSNRDETLQLELRGPDGAVVATRWIAVEETDGLTGLTTAPVANVPPADDEEIVAELEADWLDDEEFEFDDDELAGFGEDARDWDDVGSLSRYRLHVMLATDGAAS